MSQLYRESGWRSLFAGKDHNDNYSNSNIHKHPNFLSEMRRGFNKHRRPTKRVGYFAQSSRLPFSPKKNSISFKNVVNKRYTIKSELKRKLLVMCFQGPLICYALVTPEALLVTQTLYFSQFFPRFFVGFRFFLFMCNVL